jgi:ubiquinone/menaquinone biosynthesis C-methylase UbiE
MNLAESMFINSTLRVRELRRDIGPRVLAYAESTDARRVLEVGCGQGVGLELLAVHFPEAEIVGVDVDPRMIRRARRRLDSDADRIQVQVGDICALPFENASFDVVVDFAMVHHVPDWAAALREIARLLRVRGEFVFEDHDVSGHSWFARTFFAHPDERFTAREFVEGCAEVGLDVDDSLDDHGGHFIGRAVRVDRRSDQLRA